MPRPSYDDLVLEVQELAGLSTRWQAEQAITATVTELGKAVADVDARAIADQLPLEVARIFDALEFVAELSADELYEHVAARQGVGLGFGMEHAQVVCQALGRLLAPVTRIRVPAKLAHLFEPRPRPASVLVAHGVPRGRSISDGRPGSRHPLSEARPPGAHAASVVRSDEPHADRKLSSGHPASRPLSEAGSGEKGGR